MSEADGMDEAVDGAMRTGLMVARRIGEQLARMREVEQRNIAEEERAQPIASIAEPPTELECRRQDSASSRVP